MKLSSQGTKFYVEMSRGAASIPVTTAPTNIAPVKMTWTTPPATIALGDALVPSGFGWKSIDNRVFPAANLVATGLDLFGSDATREIVPASLGTVQEVAFGESCMATITLASPAGTTIDVTTLCDTARETIDGMAGISTWQATGFWDAEDPMQGAMRAYKKSNQKVAMQVEFNDGSGMIFMGTVNQFDVTMGIDQAVAFTIGGNVSGDIIDLPVGGVTILAAEPAQAPPPQPAMQPAE
jgi:hypothetical protein